MPEAHWTQWVAYALTVVDALMELSLKLGLLLLLPILGAMGLGVRRNLQELNRAQRERRSLKRDA